MSSALPRQPILPCRLHTPSLKMATTHGESDGRWYRETGWAGANCPIANCAICHDLRDRGFSPPFWLHYFCCSPKCPARGSQAGPWDWPDARSGASVRMAPRHTFSLSGACVRFFCLAGRANSRNGSSFYYVAARDRMSESLDGDDVGKASWPHPVIGQTHGTLPLGRSGSSGMCRPSRAAAAVAMDDGRRERGHTLRV